MRSTRRQPLSTQRALLGTLGIILAVAAIIGLSDSLLVTAKELPPLEAPELDDEERRPGEVTCPAGEDVARRGVPIPVTSFELIECPALFDGERVRYEGEAVGAVLLRSDHAWLHLNDDPYGLQIGPLSSHRTAVGGNSGMAVSVPRNAAIGVTVGGFRRHGTGVSVVGTYWRTSSLDGGAPAIHADEVRVVRQAQSFGETLSLRRAIAAALVTAVALGLAGVNFLQRRREHAV